MSHAPAEIRKFIVERFSDGELENLCFDYFPAVYQDFADSMTKGRKVQLLLDYCQRRGRLPDLLATLERERPQVYKEKFPSTPFVETPIIKPTIPIERNPRQVFISYAHQDAQFAQRLANDLKAKGLEIWMAPDSIKPGEKWVEAINRGLAECGVFMLVLTRSSVNSRWVESETNAAIELEHAGKLRFVPLQVEEVKTSPLWAVYQHVSFREGYGAGLESLLSQLENEVKKTSEFNSVIEVRPASIAGRVHWQYEKYRREVLLLALTTGLYAGLGAVVTSVGTMRDISREEGPVDIFSTAILVAIFFIVAAVLGGIWGWAITMARLALTGQLLWVRMIALGLLGSIIGTAAFGAMVQAVEYSWLTGTLVGLVVAWLPFPAESKTWVENQLIPGIGALLVGVASWGVLTYMDKGPSDNIFGVLASALFAALFLHKVAEPLATASQKTDSASLD